MSADELTGAGAPKLRLPSKVMAVQYRLLLRVRHRRAFEAPPEHGDARDFAEFQKARQCLIVTFKRSGEPVPTPVNFGISTDGLLYFRTEPHVAKIKRLRRDPRVRVCPCNVRGKPTGSFVEATARILPTTENERAYRVIAANWRGDMKLAERGMDRIGVPMLYVELAPAAGTVEDLSAV
jgi:PPOX class probable F420-dependent enzyme